MTNFLTFSETVFHPGPRMNLILGPNGAGKSTIVSAVCIVFGGAPKLLGRNLDLGSFVKHGAHQAEIEVLLYDPNTTAGVKQVKRDFDSDGKGSFYVDGHKVTAKQLKHIINERYDVQLDNLSQFMPQERITEFTNLSNNELLEITIRSLGGEERVKDFSDLSQSDDNANTGQERLKALMAEIEKLQSQQDESAGEVDAFREQQRLAHRADLLRRYVPTLEKNAMKEEIAELFGCTEDIKEQMEKLREELANADSGPVNMRKQEVRAAKETEKHTRTASRRKDDTANGLVSRMETIVMELDGKQKEISDVDRKARQHQKGIEAAETKLARAEEALSQQGDVKEVSMKKQIDELQYKKNELREERMSVSADISRIEAEVEDVSRHIRHHNHKLRSIESVRDQRIQHLARQYQQRQIIDCARLVEEMKSANAFRGNVHGPIAAEIEVSNEYHQRIMEHCIKGFMMTAFVSEYSCDSKLLIQECRQRFNGWTPDMITSPTTRNDEIDRQAISNQLPRRPIDERLKRLGIDAVIADIFSAPPAVKAALNAQAFLHDIHVGNSHSESEGAESALRAEQGMSAWYTPTRRCQLQGSRYHSGPKNLSIDYHFEYVRGKFFAGRMDTAERERSRLAGLIRDDEGRLNAAKQRLDDGKRHAAEFKEQYDVLANELRQLTDRLNKREGLKAQVERMKQHVQSLRDRAASLDIESEKTALEGQIQQLEIKAEETAQSVTAALQGLRQSMAEYDDARMARIRADHNLAMEDAKNSALRDRIKEEDGKLQQVKSHIQSAKVRYKEKKNEAKRALPQREREKNEQLFEELEAKYGSNVEALHNEIEALDGRAQGLTTGGRRILEEFNHRQKQLDMMNKTLTKNREEQDRHQSKLRERKEAFLSWLKNGIEKMRMKFSSLYRRLGCSGDLELINTESERIGNMSLQILVSYRDDVELRPISSSANSGGEKMCCTMLFCFALLLEEERMPPFVFVDELNQGLDPENELKIMTIMFEDAEKDTAPQSFVVTPKLLLNLPFHSQTKSHIIFNGSVSKSDVVAPMPTD